MQLYNYPFTLFFMYLLMLFIPIIATSFFVTPSNDKSKIKYIEGLRGVACLSVFINHSAYLINDSGIINNIIDLSNYSLFGKSGALGVQIFFCITGFLFSNKILSPKENEFNSFFEKRINRLVPMYIFASTLVAIIYFSENYALMSLERVAWQMSKIFGFGFFGSELYWGEKANASLNIVTWTLPYEWRFYAILPFIACVLKKRNELVLLILFGAIIAYLDIRNGYAMWLYFVAGVFCGKTKLITVKNKVMKITLLVMAVLLFVISFFIDSGKFGFERFLIISVLFLLLTILKPSLLSTSSVVFIGKISYSMYLLHQPILYIVLKTFSQFHDPSTYTEYELGLIAIIFLSITIYASNLTYKNIELRFMN